MKHIENPVVFGDDIPTLPPVPAIPPPKMEQITGDFGPLFTDSMAGYLGSFNDDGPKVSADPIGPDDPVPQDPEHDAAIAILENSTEFAKLPEWVRVTILLSRTLSISWSAKFATGLKIGVAPGSDPRPAYYNRITNTIYIKQTYFDASSGEQYGPGFNTALFLGIMAHEMGHVFTINQVSIDTSSRQAFIESNLTAEALAAVYNLFVYHLLGGQGINVGVYGGNSNGAFEGFYGQFLIDKNMDSLVNKIKTHLSGNATLNAYYGDYWDENYGP